MRRIYYLIYFACLILFMPLSCVAHWSYNLPSDNTFHLWLNGINLSFVDSFMRVVSNSAETIPATISIAVVVIVLWFSPKGLEVNFVAMLSNLAILLYLLLKVLIDRPRPASKLISNSGLNFAKVYVIYVITFFSLLFYLEPKLIEYPVVVSLCSFLVMLILLTAIIHIYLREHWASDVLGSVLLGALLIIPTIILYKRCNGDNRKCQNFLR